MYHSFLLQHLSDAFVMSISAKPVCAPAQDGGSHAVEKRAVSLPHTRTTGSELAPWTTWEWEPFTCSLPLCSGWGSWPRKGDASMLGQKDTTPGTHSLFFLGHFCLRSEWCHQAHPICWCDTRTGVPAHGMNLQMRNTVEYTRGQFETHIDL